MIDDAQLLLRLRALTLAHDQLLRSILAAWAAEHPDPQTFVTRAIEGLIASIDSTGGPAFGRDAEVRDLLTAELNRFAEDVRLRLRHNANGKGVC